MPGFLAWLGITLLTTAASVLLRPKAKSSISVPEVELPKVEPGRPIPVAFGTVKLAPHIVDLTYVDRTPVYARQDVAGITVSKTRVGTNYYLSYVGVLCWGRMERLVDVIFDGRHRLSDKGDQPDITFEGLTPTITARPPFTLDNLGGGGDYTFLLPWGVGAAHDQWDGVLVVDINLPYLYGGEQQGGGVVGPFHLYEGTNVQVPSATYETFTGMDQPAYQKLVYVYSHHVWHGEHPQPKAIEWVLTVKPEYWLTSSFGDGLDGDAHPVDVLYALLVSPDYGLGLPPALLDWDAFVALASEMILHRPFGISFVLDDRATTLEQVIDEVCRTADLVLYQDVESGQLTIRQLYDESDTTPPLYDETDYEAIEWERDLAGELPNQIKVVYTDRTLNFQRNVVVAESASAIEQAGRVISETLEFPMLSTAERAAQVAVRELRARSAQLRRCRIRFRRAAGDLTPGARLRVPWPPTTRGDEASAFVVLRVLDVDWGTLADGHIDVEAIEDVYSLPAPTGVTVTLPPTPPGTDDEIGDVSGPLVTMVVTEDETTGSVGLQIIDPFGAVTLVEFRTQSGTAAPSAWTEDAEAPFEATVAKAVSASAQIAWRVTYTDAAGEEQTLEGGYTFGPRAADPELDGVTGTVYADFGSGIEPVLADFGSGDDFVHATFPTT